MREIHAYLCQHGPAGLGKVATHCRMANGEALDLLQQMEAQGLVTREGDEWHPVRLTRNAAGQFTRVAVPQ